MRMDVTEVKPSEIVSLSAILRAGFDIKNMFSKDSLARAELFGSMLNDARKSEIARKRMQTFMQNLAIKGEHDSSCRERFVKCLNRLANKDFIGLLGAKVRCLNAKSAGVEWILHDERTLQYLNLDHVSMLLANTFESKMGLH